MQQQSAIDEAKEVSGQASYEVTYGCSLPTDRSDSLKRARFWLSPSQEELMFNVARSLMRVNEEGTEGFERVLATAAPRFKSMFATHTSAMKHLHDYHNVSGGVHDFYLNIYCKPPDAEMLGKIASTKLNACASQDVGVPFVLTVAGFSKTNPSLYEGMENPPILYDAGRNRLDFFHTLKTINRQTPANITKNCFWFRGGEFVLIPPPEIYQSKFDAIKTTRERIICQHLESIIADRHNFVSKTKKSMMKSHVAKLVIENSEEARKVIDEIEEITEGMDDLASWFSAEDGERSIGSNVKMDANHFETGIEMVSRWIENSDVSNIDLFKKHEEKIAPFGKKYVSNLMDDYYDYPFSFNQEDEDLDDHEIKDLDRMLRSKPIPQPKVPISLIPEQRNYHAVVTYVPDHDPAFLRENNVGPFGLLRISYASDNEENCNRVASFLRDLHGNVFNIFVIPFGQRIFFPLSHLKREKTSSDMVNEDLNTHIHLHPQSKEGADSYFK